MKPLTWLMSRKLIAAAILGYVLCETMHGADQTLNQRGRWPGFRRGGAMQVVVSGPYAYVAAGGLQIIDISHPAEMKLAGGILSGDDLRQVSVSGNYAGVIDSRGLRVIDISDPARPRQVGACTNSGSFGTVALAGQYAYLTSGTGGSGLSVLDWSDPGRPKLAGIQQPGVVFGRVTASGNMLYASAGTQLEVFDLADPAKPKRLGTYAQDRMIMDIAIEGNYAYLADSQGLQIIDVSDPANPKCLGGEVAGASLAAKADKAGRNVQPLWGNPSYTVAVAGRYAYLGGGQTGVQVIDVGIPAQPRVAGRYPNRAGESTCGVAVSGATVFLANWIAGLEAVDVGNPQAPKGLDVYPTTGDVRSIALADHYACLANWYGGMNVVNIANPAQPVLTGEYAAEMTFYGVAASGNYVLLNNSEGLDVVDLSQGGRPVRVGRYESHFGFMDVAVDGEIACVVSLGGDGLRTLDIRDPAHPKYLGGCATAFSSQRVTMSGHYAYMSAMGDGMQIVDIADPTKPRLVSTCNSCDSAWQTAAAGNYAYVATMSSGLKVVNITDPTQPRVVTGLPRNTWPAQDVRVAGRLAYLADWEGLSALDISNPAELRRVGLATGFSGWAVAVGEHSICVGLGSDGLLVFDPYQPPPELTLRVDVSGYHLTLKGEEGQTVMLQRSHDLKQWTDWLELIASGEAQDTLDPITAKVSEQYYRARLMSDAESGVRLLEKYPTSKTGSCKATTRDLCSATTGSINPLPRRTSRYRRCPACSRHRWMRSTATTRHGSSMRWTAAAGA